MRTESRLLTVFLASIAALTSLSIDMSLPAVPAIEHQFAVAAGRGGLTLSFFLAGYAVTPLLGGPLADRFGRRSVLLFSLLLFGVSAFTCTVCPTYALLLFCRLLQGCAAGIATTLPLAIVRDLLQGYKARQRVSEIATINSIMPIIAPVIGSWVMFLGSWRFVFATQAIVALFIVLGAGVGFGETLALERRIALTFGTILRNYGTLLTNRTFLTYATVYALTFACMFSFISASPLILMERMNVQRATFTFFFALIATGTILGSFTSGILSSRRTPAHGVILTGLLSMSFASIAAAAMQIAHIHRPIAILPFVFVTFFGFGLTTPSVMTEALEPLPHLAGSGSGALHLILRIFGSGASGFLATYCGRHLEHTEIATTLLMVGAALAALLLYLLRPTSPPLLEKQT